MRAYREQLGEEIHARDARSGRKSQRSSAPNDPHAVEADDIAVGDIGREHGIRPHIDEFGDVQRHMLQPSPAVHGPARQIDGFCHCQQIDGTSQK